MQGMCLLYKHTHYLPPEDARGAYFHRRGVFFDMKSFSYLWFYEVYYMSFIDS